MSRHESRSRRNPEYYTPYDMDYDIDYDTDYEPFQQTYRPHHKPCCPCCPCCHPCPLPCPPPCPKPYPKPGPPKKSTILAQAIGPTTPQTSNSATVKLDLDTIRGENTSTTNPSADVFLNPSTDTVYVNKKARYLLTYQTVATVILPQPLTPMPTALALTIRLLKNGTDTIPASLIEIPANNFSGTPNNYTISHSAIANLEKGDFLQIVATNPHEAPVEFRNNSLIIDEE